MGNHSDFFQKMISDKKNGMHKGIYSVCSVNRYVIKAAMKKAYENNHHVLIESTCNQVNQFGGYSGMRPADFREYVFGIAEEAGFPEDKILLGGDHLGPNPWRDESADSALEKSYDLIREYVQAGYSKIHLDASMLLGDDLRDKDGALDSRMIALRAAKICQVAEKEFCELKLNDISAFPPVYVIGTEVPVPGGVTEIEEGPGITSADDMVNTIELCREYFYKFDLVDAWERVIAVVVQPGLEFSNEDIYEYKRCEKNIELKNKIKEYDNLVIEAHSTDYQTGKSLKQLVEDGSGFLKVGPALTYAFREVIICLASIEKELYDFKIIKNNSKIEEVLKKAMYENNIYWKDYYHGSRDEIAFQMKYGLSDRVRYYWSILKVKNALTKLKGNLDEVQIPLPMISQYLPYQYDKIINGQLQKNVDSIICDYIGKVLDDYEFAIKE